MELSTRARRRGCGHPTLRPARGRRYMACAECGERFPCRACTHADCAEARAAGTIDAWPEWVRLEWSR